jgi:hypothetical protein
VGSYDEGERCNECLVLRLRETPPMVHNQEELLNRFPLLESIIRNLSCSDADKQLLLTLFLNVYLTGQKDCQNTHNKQ